MNRVVVYGAATFFALVGIALFGGADKAAAGHGCGGCSGVVACSGDDCGGRVGILARLRARKCCGEQVSCCGEAAPCCEPAPAPCCEPAPADCCGPKNDCCGRVGILKRMRDARCHGRDRCAGRARCCGEVVACPPTCCG